MLSKHAQATVSKRVKHAMAFFRFAVDAGLLEHSPFAKVALAVPGAGDSARRSDAGDKPARHHAAPLPAGNLATQVRRFNERAGLSPWPKVFNNLRASRPTELARTGKFTDHALTEFFGHDVETAGKRYTMTVDEDYAAAADPSTAQGHGAQTTKNDTTPSAGLDAQSARALREILAKHGLIDAVDKTDLMTPTGFEPVSRQ